MILALIAWLATVLAVAPGQSAAAAEWRSMLSGKNAFLVFSDLHFNPFDDPAIVDRLVASESADWRSILESASTTGLGPYGKDANYRLVASALASMRETIPHPDFILFAGDFLAHNFRTLFNQTASDTSDATYQTFVIKTMRFLADLFTASFPNVVVVPALGNNDSICSDYRIEPHGPFLRDTAGLVGAMIGAPAAAPDFAETWQAGGFYAMRHPVVPGVRLIVLNNTFLVPRYDNACGHGEDDPGAAQLDWLQSTLARSRSDGERVWLVYHVPAGINAYSTTGATSSDGSCPATISPFLQRRYAERFEQLMNDFGPMVQMALSGHTHMDDFRLIPAGGQAVTYDHIAPAISPKFGENPGYQVFVFDPASGAIGNVLTFYLTNLETAGLEAAADWAFEYDFNTAYGQSGMTPAALQAVYQAIGSSGDARSSYVSYYSVSRPESEQIKPAAFPGFLCAIGNIDPTAYARCYCGSPAGP